MVPTVLVRLDELPLTTNGKVDRKALRALSKDTATEYEGARNEIEELLVQVWQEVLGLERLGSHDNFFELGGHSLLATQLIAKVRSQMDVDLALRTVFERPSIAQLAQVIATAGKRKAPPIRPIDRSQFRRV